jgi:hypothetical protein
VDFSRPNTINATYSGPATGEGFAYSILQWGDDRCHYCVALISARIPATKPSRFLIRFLTNPFALLSHRWSAPQVRRHFQNRLCAILRLTQRLVLRRESQWLGSPQTNSMSLALLKKSSTHTCFRLSRAESGAQLGSIETWDSCPGGRIRRGVRVYK